jgi:ABC-type Zn uptake system ZnuABC Zn-binding protein ZnuA
LYDPHFWFDPLRVKIVVNEIAARLSAVDPEGGDVYRENAASYVTQLDELHAWTKQQVNVIPAGRRLLLTSHDSLAYFAQLYGFKVVGAVIPTSLSTEVEPTAAHLGNLVEVIAHNDVPAVFGETTVSERVAKAISNETGAKLVRLYTGSLGPEGSGADTYLGMQRTNVEKIVEALK